MRPVRRNVKWADASEGTVDSESDDTDGGGGIWSAHGHALVGAAQPACGQPRCCRIFTPMVSGPQSAVKRTQSYALRKAGGRLVVSGTSGNTGWPSLSAGGSRQLRGTRVRLILHMVLVQQ